MNYTGTIGTRFGISPFPNKELWLTFINDINKNTNEKFRKSILWNVGTFNKSGQLLNFPGVDTEYYKYSKLDYNISYFDFFDRNKVSVFLTIEPHNLQINSVLESILDRYYKHKSVEGICIDLEWLDKDIKLESAVIENFLRIIKKYNKDYKLIIKHWNQYVVRPYSNVDILYLQSLESVQSLDELVKRHTVWNRYFFPNNVGIEVGFIQDTFWYEYENPLQEIFNSIINISTNNSSFFWSETSLYKINTNYK